MLQRCFVNVLLIGVISSMSQMAFGSEWPGFRGPGGQGVSKATDLPVNWDDSKNLVWKKAMPGYGSSSPIALGDKLYVTCYSGHGTKESSGNIEDLRLHTLCINAKNGDIIWDKKFKPSLPESKKVRDHGYAAPTPVTDGKHLYLFFGKSGVFKLDLNGEQIWRTRVGDKTHGWGCGTSPVLTDDMVIVNASVESGALVAINKVTGKETWRAEGIKSSWNTPHLVKTADGKQELAVSIKGFILGYDPKTGEELWRCEGISDYICPSIISQDGILYALGGRSSKAIALRSGGRGDVTKSHKIWQADVGANVSSPVIHDGHLYWVSDRNKTAYCLGLADGAIKYAESVKIQPYASALLADGRLYIVTRFDGTLVLAAKPKFERLALNVLDDKSAFHASPIVSGGNLILRSDRYVYSFGNGR
ncbi:MAG: PQQ-like beta-propeller repeat protein [Phycisphaerae bacterium]|nr:PQQ-like beta-propeller repeat protein [Phycisphaerae bacterium]